MNGKVLHTLEFDKITAILEGYCGSAPAKNMVIMENVQIIVITMVAMEP